MKNYLLLKEKALANAVALFDYWKLQYIKVNEEEYDFINPTRNDTNFGACRFNIQKGLGSDFTGSTYKDVDFQQIGLGFSREDFIGIQDGRSISSGFDIIGLCAKIHRCSSYKSAAELLSNQLADLAKTRELVSVDLGDVTKRQYELDQQNIKRIKIARRTWDICLPIKNTLGQTYLNSRMIFLENDLEQIRFHPKIYNSEAKATIPCILMKCTLTPISRLQAIHRIYLNQNGTKSSLSLPKVALGKIKGLGIWFNSGESCPSILRIAEGPENALSVYSIYSGLVCSTINASNFSNLTIPEGIQKIILYPDNGDAGEKSVAKAYTAYTLQGIKDIEVVFPPKRKPKWDWNDELQLMLRGDECQMTKNKN